MPFAKRYGLMLLLLLSGATLHAQDITGTWQGSLGPDQFLQLNIIQNGDQLCGYTWDTVHNKKNDYCQAYFEGRYNKRKKEWILTGKDFIQNSGSHVLSRISLKMSNAEGENILKGAGFGMSVRPVFDDDLFGRRLDPFGPAQVITYGPAEFIFLEKVANMPDKILPHMRACFFDKQQAQPSTTTTIHKVPLPTVTDIPVTDIRKDSPVIVTPTGRGERIISQVPVSDTAIQLQVYDNAIIDGDTVSIFVNDKLVMEHRRLSAAPIFVNITLNEAAPLQKISLFAENLGSIPPNTALLVFIAGGKRYELFAKATLEENAVLYFEYKKE